MALRNKYEQNGADDVENSATVDCDESFDFMSFEEESIETEPEHAAPHELIQYENEADVNVEYSAAAAQTVSQPQLTVSNSERLMSERIKLIPLPNIIEKAALPGK